MGLMKKYIALKVLCLAAIVLSGCINMPTATEKLTIPVISSEAYQQWSCEALSTERARLTKLESESLMMHEKRRNASHGHVFFYGWGRGDGIETVELVRFRGEIEAVDRATSNLGCND